MNGGTIAFAFAGLIAFCVGAYIAATGERALGVTFMGLGLVFQALCLRQLRMAKAADQANEGSDDAGR
ncbi:MAG: hypothetical protein AAFR64_08230 [Pseudomonadota bacterium]